MRASRERVVFERLTAAIVGNKAQFPRPEIEVRRVGFRESLPRSSSATGSTAPPGVLRQFHACAGGGRVRGQFRVERKGGMGPARSLAAIMGMPKPGEDVTVSLRVTVEGCRERLA